MSLVILSHRHDESQTKITASSSVPLIMLLTLFLQKYNSDYCPHPNESDEWHSQRGGMMSTRIWYPQAMVEEGRRYGWSMCHCRQGWDGFFAGERSAGRYGRQIKGRTAGYFLIEYFYTCTKF